MCDASDCSDEPGGWDGDACTMPDQTLHLTSGGSVLYNSSSLMGGFQFNVDGASILGASGGAAQDAGFTVSAGGTTVLGFSFTGATIAAGCGTLTELSLDGTPTGLSGIVISDPVGSGLDFEYYDGGGSIDVCEDDSACNFGEEGDCEYAEDNFDCDGNCIVAVSYTHLTLPTTPYV